MSVDRKLHGPYALFEGVKRPGASRPIGGVPKRRRRFGACLVDNP
jgi:hypothetical protein